MEIVPHRSVGPIKFGMSLVQVREKLGAPIKSFLRSPISVHPCDVYSDWGVIINYTAKGIVEAVELCSPETAILDGDDLLRLDYAQLQLRLAQGGEVSKDDGSLTSLPLGIGGYAPDVAKRKKAKLQSVIAFAQDYYH